MILQSNIFSCAILSVLIFSLCPHQISSNDRTPNDAVMGAWQSTSTIDGTPITQRLLINEKFFSWTTFKTADGAFINTFGGSCNHQGKFLHLLNEFHSSDKSRVGALSTLKFKFKDGKLLTKADKGGWQTWESVEDNSNTALTGSWLFSGRKRDGEISRRETDQPRKTMKLLTAGKFQWIAYNTETKEFFGSGGGSYELDNGQYIEKIEFFSRDDSRVGARLEFDFDVQGDDWHHSGFSSKGDPMYEIWSRRK